VAALRAAAVVPEVLRAPVARAARAEPEAWRAPVVQEGPAAMAEPEALRVPVARAEQAVEETFALATTRRETPTTMGSVTPMTFVRETTT